MDICTGDGMQWSMVSMLLTFLIGLAVGVIVRAIDRRDSKERPLT